MEEIWEPFGVSCSFWAEIASRSVVLDGLSYRGDCYCLQDQNTSHGFWGQSYFGEILGVASKN